MTTQQSRWAYLAVLTPLIWATTYYLTTEFLPPGRPWLASLVRSLPTGLVLVIGSRPPTGRWWSRLLLLSVLYSSGFFPLLFLAAYRLPGGVASVINSLGPILVVLLSVKLLDVPIKGIDLIAGAVGVTGVALLVLTDQARLDPLGIAAMVTCVVMISLGNVLAKRWGTPPGMTSLHLTGWLFLLGGLTLLPATLLFEGLPTDLSTRNWLGYAYLVIFGGIVSYALWFWALRRLTASAVTFLGLLNPVAAALIGWVLLDQRLSTGQLIGAALVVVSVLLGQVTAMTRSPVARPG
ncbi:MAG: DMT family transporter [Actinomycetales bacterium]